MATRAAVVMLALVLAPSALYASEPIRVWEIDFNDPAEPSRWIVHPRSSPGAPVQIERISRGESRSALRISASGVVGVGTDVFLHRLFPESFQPSPDSVFVLDWEWKIADVKKSDWVGLGIVYAREDGFTGTTSVVSHTRRSIHWGVLFEPGNLWRPHRMSAPEQYPWMRGWSPIGINVNFLDPVNQAVSFSKLRVEEWPADAIELDPIYRPHRFPPPAEPFADRPVESLWLAMAGALEDLNGDGHPELLVLERQGYMHLYENDGHGSFAREITARAGLHFPTLGTGAMFLDLDGDRDVDLVITSEFDVPRLFENVGDLVFRPHRVVSDEHLSFWYGAAADDVDRDGDPDLLFTSPYVPEFLFLRNEGGWRFRPELLFSLGSLGRRGDESFSSAFADFQDDGWPDLFTGKGHFLRNDAGQLRHDDNVWSAEPNTEKTEGAVFGDFSGDGRVDLLIVRDLAEHRGGHTALMIADGSGRFRERLDAGFPPLRSAEVALAEDFDNDGDLDLYFCQRNQPNHLLLNDGTGHFTDATESSGFIDDGGCDSAVTGDIDGDGGMDIVIFRYGSAPRIMTNRLDRGNWVGVVVRGEGPGTDAIGAKVRILDSESGSAILTRWIRRGRGFGSTGPGELRFGVGARNTAVIEVEFPSGATRRLRKVAVNSTALVQERHDWLASARFPVRRWFARDTSRGSRTVWVVASAAFVVGMGVAARRPRWLAMITLALGVVGAALLGSVPGRGLAGSPLILWVGGGVLGIVLPLSVAGLARLRRRYRWATVAGAASLEEMIRFTQDFRHAGVETRNILSIHNRVQNLFLDGDLHQAFLKALPALIEHFGKVTVPRLRQLTALAQGVFTDLEVARSVEKCAERVDKLLRELTRLDKTESTLQRWRDRTLPHLVELRDRLPQLLTELDQRSSCDLRSVVDDVVTTRGDLLRANDVKVDLVFDPPNGPKQVVISRPELSLVLENLLTNAVAAMRTSSQKRIRITVRGSDRRVSLECADTGPRIADEDRARVFDYGFSRRPGGQGYGLARSREVLGHYGGSIVLEDRESEQRTVFTITLRAVR